MSSQELQKPPSELSQRSPELAEPSKPRVLSRSRTRRDANAIREANATRRYRREEAMRSLRRALLCLLLRIAIADDLDNAKARFASLQRGQEGEKVMDEDGDDQPPDNSEKMNNLLDAWGNGHWATKQ